MGSIRATIKTEKGKETFTILKPKLFVNQLIPEDGLYVLEIRKIADPSNKQLYILKDLLNVIVREHFNMNQQLISMTQAFQMMCVYSGSDGTKTLEDIADTKEASYYLNEAKQFIIENYNIDGTKLI